MKILNTIFAVRAQKAGRKITPAKSAAARTNGKLGGRPKKQHNTTWKN